MDEGSELWQFCGFVNGSSFRTRYFMDESTMTLTACAELLLVSLQTVPLLFYTIINMCLVHDIFRRFTSKSLSFVFLYRIFACVATVALLSVSIGFAILSAHKLKSAFIIEYGIAVLTWLLFGLFWVYSLSVKSWSRSTGITVSSFFASKAFFLITVNRWLLFGFTDIQTLTVFSISLILIINSVLNLVERSIYKSTFVRLTDDDDYVHLNEDADEGSNCLSKIFFCWTNELISKGGREQLNVIEDVFALPPSLQVATVERELIENSPTYYSDGLRYSLARSLLSTFGLSFFLLGFVRMASDVFTFAGPVLLHLMVDALENPVMANTVYLYSALMVTCSLFAALFSCNFNYYVQKMSIRVRGATVTAIYDKLLRVPLAEMSSFSSGQILNFVSTDIDRLVNFFNSFHAFWSLPFQLIIALYLLYREVGQSYLAGLVAAILLIPINKCITNAIGKASEKLMTCKDQRIKLITETMEGIRVVKSSAWEKHFEEMIGELREKELRYLKIRKYLDAVCVYLWASAPLLICISILACYTMVFHEKLTAAKVFTSLALVNILIMPLNAFPWVLNGLVEALVSLKRLEWFFSLKNVDLHDVYALNTDKHTLMSVSNASFCWKNGDAICHGVTFEGKSGSIIGITGDFGSGKSSLLLGLLGETKGLTELIGIHQESINEGIGYLGQDRWLCRGTIKENILAGKPFDADLYNSVLRAACLQRDINLFPGGDIYEISDNGATLSGGQRTRVALARLFYQENSIILLDEPFASLDRKVADHIWREGLEVQRKRGALVIVATHDTRLLARASQVIALDRSGSVKETGPPEVVLKNFTKEEANESEETTEIEEQFEHVTLQDEDKMKGAVRAGVYGAYAKATGVCLSTCIVIALAAMQISKNSADWWLSQWTQSQENLTSLNDAQSPLSRLLWEPRELLYMDDAEFDRSLYFLTVYAIIAAANTIFTLIRAFLFAYGGIVAARFLHVELLHKLLQAPLSWWDKTPAGRVINRLCADIYTCDDNLSFQLNIFLASLFNLIGALVISLMGLQILAPVVVLLFVVYYFIQKYYRKTTVELKRLTSLSLSPFYSHLSDTVNGLVTIRAHRFIDRVSKEMRHRLTNNLRAQFSSLAASQWLSIRLSLIAVVVVGAITLAAVIQHIIYGVDSGLVGLALTYALSMTSLLNGLLGSFIETEKEMVAVERVAEYIEDVPVEEDQGKNKLSGEISGRLDVVSVSLRYDRSLPLALENVSFTVESGQRVALIGRTGSGKSSIIQALLRLTAIESGRILIDGVDIATIPLAQLRSLFGVVPQHPFIFSGSFYNNLVVGLQQLDTLHVANIARVAKLDGLLVRIGGLDGMIEEGGKNLSYGEKQIISICRVLLAKPKIVLLDEATSHLDDTAHSRMMSLITAHLPLATVISVVHKLEGLSSYDMVVEMEKGRISRVNSRDSFM